MTAARIYELGAQASGAVIASVDPTTEKAKSSTLTELLTSVALTGSATWDAGEIADGDEEAKEITVTGAALGDFVLVSHGVDVADLAITAQVTAASTVTATLLNNTGGPLDLTSTTVRAVVLPKSLFGL